MLAHGVMQPVFSAEGDLFSYDRQEVQEALAPVEEVASFVRFYEVDGEDVIAYRPELRQALRTSYSYAALMGQENRPMGIPSFFWGCCTGPLGIVLVLVESGEGVEALKATGGMVVSLAGLASAGTLLGCFDAEACVTPVLFGQGCGPICNFPTFSAPSCNFPTCSIP